MRTASGHDDSGVALLVVIGAVALLIILLTAAFYVSSQTLFQTQMADQHEAAFEAASSGVIVAFTDLRARFSSHPTGGTWSGSLPTTSAVYSVTAALNAAGTSYDCTSTGIANDGTRERVVATFAVGTGTTSSLPWGSNVFYFGNYTGGSIVGNGAITGPFYIAFPGPSFGSVDMGSAAASINGGPLYVYNGNLTLKQAPSAPLKVYTNGTMSPTSLSNVTNMGWDPSKALPITRIDATTFLATALSNATAQSSDNVMGTTGKPNYEAHTVGDAASYTNAATNPPNNRPSGWVRSRAVGAASAYKVINSAFTLGSSTASFGSWSGDGHSPVSTDLHDDFAYDSVNHVLYVEGTVYVNGNLTISRDITYVGNGAIVCNGAITISGSIKPATANGTDGIPEPDARHLLGLFATGNITFGANNVTTVAAAYTLGQVLVSANNNTLKGSFVAELGLGPMGNGTNITAVPLIATYVGPGLPVWGGVGTGTSGLTMSSWHRL